MNTRRITIRSSGPLRRVAVLLCGGQQRPLNSSVRPQRALLVLVVLLTALRLRPPLRSASFVPQLGRPASRAQNARGQPSSHVPRESAHRTRVMRASLAFSARRCRNSVVGSVARLRQRRPSLLRAVAMFSSRRYCLLKVVHSVRPNYSFNATVQSFSQIPAPGAAR